MPAPTITPTPLWSDSSPPLPAELRLEIDSRFGSGWSLHELGSNRRTHAVGVDRRTLAIVKTLRADRQPEALRRVLAIARAHGIACPQLLAAAPVATGWLGLFEYLEGHAPDPDSDTWAATWREALALLRPLAEIREVVAPWDLETEWLDRVAPAAEEDEAARALLARLRHRALEGSPGLAHGDFAPQNFVLGPGGCSLVDWEDVGYARPGFDAGWLLSLNRIGAGPRWPQAVLHDALVPMGIPRANLVWFEGIGLLRMHARAHALPGRSFERAFLLEVLRAAVRAFADDRSPYAVGST